MRYMEIEELIHNPRLPILFLPPPPQVVISSSAPETSINFSNGVRSTLKR